MSNGVATPGALSAVPNGDSKASTSTVTVNQNGKRELSPDRSGPPQKSAKASHGSDAKGSSSDAKSGAALATMGRGQGIDLRAEEEAARRAFSRSAVGNLQYAGENSRARQTDLFGEQALRARLSQLAQRHGMVVDDEAMRYLAMAAEMRVRALLSSAVRTQQHRVHSTHQRKPPMSKGSGSKAGKPLWSQKATSDTNAVMVALATANKEENKAHRVARTERNARETEIARAQAAAKEREREREGSSVPQDTEAGAASSAAISDSEEAPPSGGASATGAASASAAASSSTPGPTFQATPTFGAPPPKKSKGGKKGAAKDVSSEVQAKITNATAFMAVGRKRKYAWELGAGAGAFKPPVPSLLSGKRKKGADDADSPGPSGAEAPASAAAPAAEASAAVVKPKKAKRTLSGPHRRQVDVHHPGDKRARDDTALTVADFVFALDHEGSGRGMGTADELVRRMRARPQPAAQCGRW
ncbi:uncharacterized protein LOC62_02G002446 [Vanrija pseudolonga]|uniref:Transcription initiation factor TFIID subunit 4 n=1 Tax=Vanrija pseudolonga TaxID=143232 RepID=A0AAF0Y2M9_9TREE|nr:hypothetical protein LOC62_02G002446 [Vanrija pseudolonga]